MAAATYLQSSFLGGAVSKSMQGRFDHPAYRTWMNVCLNSMPMEQGAWTRRPGSRHLYPTRFGQAGRVLSFDFKQASPYTMEFTPSFLRFRAGPNIVTTNDDQVIVSISAANPAKVKTGTHGWTGGNHVIFKNLGANNPKLQNRMFVAIVTSPTEFTLQDGITGANIDGATLGTFISGTVSRVLDLLTPYGGTLWSSLRAIQADIPTLNSTTPGAVLLQATIKPYVLQVTTPPTDTEFATFSISPINFKDGPYFDPVPGGALATPSALIGNINLTLSFNAYDAARSYSIGEYVLSGGVNYKSLVDANVGFTPALSPGVWVAVGAADAIGPNGFVGTDIGRMVRLYSEPAIWVVGATYSIGNVVAYGGAGLRYDGATYWKSLANSNTGNIPGVDLTKWALFPTGAMWTWGKIISLTTEIDRALAGSVNIGDLTDNGGLAAGFDGVINQIAAQGASKFVPNSSIVGGYIGKNYAAASDQIVGSATVYPAIDTGFIYYIGTINSVTFNLRGNSVVPTSKTDGTLLGSTTINGTQVGLAVQILSNDLTTAWKYLWIDISVDLSNTAGHTDYNVNVAEVKFFHPPGTGTGAGVVLQIIGDALLYTTGIRTWRLGLYSDTTGWPTCGTYHEGRLWLSGAIANRIDSSKSNDVFNMAPTNPDGSVSANNGISYIFNAPDVNPIFWMVPDHLGIVCGTQGGEWLVQATSQNLPLTPTTIQAHRYTKYNCANIEPRRTDLTLAVVQAYKKELLEYFSDVYSGRFAAHDIADQAKHLMATGMQELAYQQETIPVIWARTGDGNLIGVTYRRQSLISSQPPDFAGWHPHTLGSGRTIESICTGSNADGTLDALVMVTNDSSNVRHVEMLTNYFTETTDPADAWFVDDAVQPSSTQHLPAPSAGAPYGGLTINGLWYLNGKTVQVFAAGLDCGQGEVSRTTGARTITDFVVSNGSIFVPYGDGNSAGTGGGLFTETFAAAAIAAGQLIVGFTYTSDGQIVRPNAPTEAGTRNGPAFGKLRRNQQYMILVNQTAGLSIGTRFDVLDPVKFSAEGAGRALAFGSVFSGVYRAELRDDDSFDGMVCWRVTRPMPATIAAVGAAIHTQDI